MWGWGWSGEAVSFCGIPQGSHASDDISGVSGVLNLLTTVSSSFSSPEIGVLRAVETRKTGGGKGNEGG